MESRQTSLEIALAALHWYESMGVTDIIGEAPSDLSLWEGRKLPVPEKPTAAPQKLAATRQTPAVAPTPVTGSMPASMPADMAAAEAARLAGGAQDLPQLKAIIEDFDGCALKAGARNTVVYDGIEGAALLVIGEAPGKEEDRTGKPFVGRAGQLLDRMLAAIGHARSGAEGFAPAMISNSIFWRPPGNRTPTGEEIAICLAFVSRLIELSDPKVILLAGNTPTQALFPGTAGITRTRGIWKEWRTQGGKVIPTLPLFHPAYLLRAPAQKRLAWADLLSAKAKLETGA